MFANEFSIILTVSSKKNMINCRKIMLFKRKERKQLVAKETVMLLWRTSESLVYANDFRNINRIYNKILDSDWFSARLFV